MFNCPVASTAQNCQHRTVSYRLSMKGLHTRCTFVRQQSVPDRTHGPLAKLTLHILYLHHAPLRWRCASTSLVETDRDHFQTTLSPPHLYQTSDRTCVFFKQDTRPGCWSCESNRQYYSCSRPILASSGNAPCRCQHFKTSFNMCSEVLSVSSKPRMSICLVIGLFVGHPIPL